MEQRYKPRHRAAYCKRNLRRRGRAAPATDTRAYAPAALRVQIPVGAPNKYPMTNVITPYYLHRKEYCRVPDCGNSAGPRLSAEARAYAPAALRVQIPVGAPNKYPRPKFWVGGICGAPHAT